jgi:hypothetical protein
MLDIQDLQQAANETYNLGDLCIEWGEIETIPADFEKDICLTSLSNLLQSYKLRNDYVIADLEDIFYIDAQTLRKVLKTRYVGKKIRNRIYSQLAAKGELNLK